MDVAGKDGEHYLVIVDYYSQYPEIFQLLDTKTSTTRTNLQLFMTKRRFGRKHTSMDAIEQGKDFRYNPTRGARKKKQSYNWVGSYMLEGEKPTIRTMPRENIAASLEEEEDRVQRRSLSRWLTGGREGRKT
ncbi:hypothetical protein PR048_017998 [Dryococelus australis]|uniref:Uncharacterized protein n=1 Tax=Dryococelus australis TaxID=614101 RepID=A0ABQ9HB72_9NEOP|nr:hypothetical protein PR048_017998 [Dryococelus australis]